MNILQALPGLLLSVSALSHAAENKREIYAPVAGPAGSFMERKFASAAVADIMFLGLSEQEMAGKVFFAANGPEDDYAELYTNINKARGTVEIREKDSEYRRNVIRALSK